MTKINRAIKTYNKLTYKQKNSIMNGYIKEILDKKQMFIK